MGTTLPGLLLLVPYSVAKRALLNDMAGHHGFTYRKAPVLLACSSEEPEASMEGRLTAAGARIAREDAEQKMVEICCRHYDAVQVPEVAEAVKEALRLAEEKVGTTHV
jgi:hypothetical protein